MSLLPPKHVLMKSDCRSGVGPEERLADTEIEELQQLLPEWQVSAEALVRTFSFSDFAHAMAFAVQVGAMADEQDHHPDLQVGWGRCEVRFSTHSAEGTTLNDAICAVRSDAFYPAD